MLTTITFFGERQDIFDPDAAVPVAGHATERRSSVRQRLVDDLSGHAQQGTRRDLVLATVPCRGTARLGQADPLRQRRRSPFARRYLTPSPPVAIPLTSSGTSRLTMMCTSIPAATAIRWTLWAVDPPRSIFHHRLR